MTRELTKKKLDVRKGREGRERKTVYSSRVTQMLCAKLMMRWFLMRRRWGRASVVKGSHAKEP